MRIFVTILFVCLLQNSFAGNIYVTSTGNDGLGDGTIGNPYLTPSKALSVAVFGDVVQIMPGLYSYSTSLIVPTGVSINGFDSASVTLQSTVTGGNGITMTSPVGTNGNQTLSNFKITTTSFATLSGINITGRSNVTVDHVTIRDFNGNGILFNGNTTINTRPSIYAYGNRLQYCQIINNSDRTVSGASGNVVVSGFRPLSGDTGMVIRDNYINQSQRALGHNGDNFVIPAGDSSSVEGLKYFNNVSIRNQDDVGGDWSFHMEMWDAQGGMEIGPNNIFRGGNQMNDLAGTDTSYRSFGLHGSYMYNFYIHDNLFQIDTPFASATTLLVVGIDIEGDKSDVIIRNNQFKNVPYGVQTNLNHAGAKGQRRIYVDHNVFDYGGFDNGNFAFDYSIIGSDQSALVRDCFVNNNTIVNTRTKAGCFISLGAGDSLINFSFSNNIVRDVPGTGYGAITFSESTGFKDSIYMNNNILYNNTNSNNIFYRNSATVPTHFFNTGTLKVDPMLDANYYPVLGSPALSAGSDGSDIGAKGLAPVVDAGPDQLILYGNFKFINL